MKNPLHQNVTLLRWVVAALLMVVVVLLSILLFMTSRTSSGQWLKYPQDSSNPLVGLKERRISKHSERQVELFLQSSPYVMGGWVTRLQYEKTENPIVFFVSKKTIIDKFYKNYVEIQESGRGFSSAELDASSEQSLRNSIEARTGLIKCGPLSQTNLPRIAPGIEKQAKGVCRATIPPFDENVTMAIVVVLNVDGTVNSPQVQEVRRMLLQLQIDIYNRDWQGREIWARR